MGRVFVVIVNYNTSEYVESLAAALELRAGVTLIVVDNCSSNANIDRLASVESKYAHMKVEWLPENVGFAKGVHAGVEACDADDDDALWILNPDTMVPPGALEHLWSTLCADRFDIVSPLIATGRVGEEVVWFAGGEVDLRRGRTLHECLGQSLQEYRKTHHSPYSTKFLTGAAPMMKFRIWRQLGGFRKDFFMYWEDADFSRRALQAGMDLGVVPTVEIWHAVGAASSSTGKSPLYYRCMMRNRLVCMSEFGGRRSIFTFHGLMEAALLFARACRGGRGRFARMDAALTGFREGLRSSAHAAAPSLNMDVCSSRHFVRWEERHQKGDVPSKYPYGFEHLQEATGCAVASVELPPIGSLRAMPYLALTLARQTLGSTEPRVGVSWEENYALRMLLERSYVRNFSGLIWATDALDGMSFGRLQFMKHMLNKLDGIWCLSRAQIPVLKNWLGDRCPPVHFVRFGIDTEFFTAAQPAQQPLIVSLGIDRDRDRLTLLEAFEIVLAKRPDAQLVLQGERPDTSFNTRNVTFVNTLNHRQVRSLYRDSAVVALATRQNLHVSGMTVALEAMSTGRPVVITRTPGIEDYVQDGVTGTLCEVGDEADIADALLRYLDDETLRAAVGRAGAEYVRQVHTSMQMVDSIAFIVKGGKS